MLSSYPDQNPERSSWILSRRGMRNTLDPQKPYAYFCENERSERDEIVPVATIFLTNRECPWHCLMCDLWQNALTDRVPAGNIPAQINFALQQMPPAKQIKLYNNGSFFDPMAIPPEDYESIATIVSGFTRVIVESHPALIDSSCIRFRNLLQKHERAELEIAMGLETANVDVLDRLNKRMTLDQFERAAFVLRNESIRLRAFVLVQPPFIHPEEALVWAQRSMDFAFHCGASVVSLIPTRGGNGAMETLREMGVYSQPGIRLMESALESGIQLGRGRVFLDLWNFEQFSKCPCCLDVRKARLHEMNLQQVILPSVSCEHCNNFS